jgi:hypothetical protein
VQLPAVEFCEIDGGQHRAAGEGCARRSKKRDVEIARRDEQHGYACASQHALTDRSKHELGERPERARTGDQHLDARSVRLLENPLADGAGPDSQIGLFVSRVVGNRTCVGAAQRVGGVH